MPPNIASPGAKRVGLAFNAYGVLVLAAVERRSGDFDAAAVALSRADDSIAKDLSGDSLPTARQLKTNRGAWCCSHMAFV